MTAVFLNLLEKPETTELFESVSESEVYNSFQQGAHSVAKVQFSLMGMLDLESWSKILDMKKSKVVEEAVYRITTLNVESDPKLKEFWEKTVLPQISLILKSVA